MGFTLFKKRERLDFARLNKFGREMITSIRAGRGIKVVVKKGEATVSIDAGIPRPRPSFFAIITGAVESPADSNQYVYEWEEAAKPVAGYGEWAAKTSGRVGGGVAALPGAYCLHEEINSSTGVQSGGINVDGSGYPANFTVQAVPDDTVVLMHIVTLTDGETLEYWFTAAHSAHDGTCS